MLVGQGGTCPREFSIRLAHLGLMALCRAQLGLIWRGTEPKEARKGSAGEAGAGVVGSSASGKRL